MCTATCTTLYLLALGLLLIGVHSQQTNDLINLLSTAMNMPMEPPPSTYPSTSKFIEQQGFTAEKYSVTTEDGYILSLNRIRNKMQGPPVLIMHGVLASSDQWLLMGRQMSLPFILADAGYDVWLGDERGSVHSRRHTSYSPRDKRFWNFSFHESGMYDLPAFIDFILGRTKYSRVFYVGHSMGTSVFLVMASTRPEYNNKVAAAMLLAPIATPPNRKDWGPGLRIVDQGDNFYKVLTRNEIHEFLPRNGGIMKMIQLVCGSPRTQVICFEFAGAFYGQNKRNWDLRKIGFYFSSIPAGTSLKTMHHLSQVYSQGRFQQYDYGPNENLKIYGSIQPPMYNVSKITAPVALYSGINDKLMNVQTADALANSLPKLIKNYIIPDPNYCHIDFQFGLNSRDILFNDIVKVFNKLS